jgi:hypothetical protein
MLTIALFLFLQQAPTAAPVQAPATAAPAAAPQLPAAAPVVAPAPRPAPAPPKAVVPPPELLQVKNIYILPMGGGFDQYLANQLSRKGLVQVVTNPAKADAVLADRLGKPFEQAFEELYPEFKPPAPVAKPKTDEEEKSSSTSFDMKNQLPARTSSFGRGKGTYFLVSRSSRNVVWSVYAKPKS